MSNLGEGWFISSLKKKIVNVEISVNEAFKLFLFCTNNCQYVTQASLKLRKLEVFPLPVARTYINDRELVNQSLQTKYDA